MNKSEKTVPYSELERPLRSGEERYKDILNNIEEGYYEVDLEGNFLFFNDSVCRVLGYPKEELLGMNNRQLMDEKNAQKVFEVFNRVFKSGKTVRLFEYEILKRDGSPCSVEASISLIRKRQGKPVGFRGIVRDISGRKKTEEQLELFYRFAEASGQGLLLMDSEYNIEYTNLAFGRMIGEKNIEEAQKNNIDYYYEEETRRRLHGQILPIVVEKGQWMGEMDLTSLDGRLVPSFNNIFVIKGNDGETQYFANVITDIAEQKNTAKKLKKAKEEADKANKAKSEFLANMSHEIRTPLNGILGFSDLLLDEELTEEQHEAVRAIRESGENLLNLINDILDLSKVESHKIILENIPFDVGEMLLDVCDLMRSNLGEKSVEINCSIEEFSSGLSGDPTRVRQIMMNLVGNAVKFTNQGEIHVGVFTENEEEGNIILKFMVKDTGPGIPGDKLESIFESFNQVDGSTTRKYGGTGLGLSISKKLSILMGGDLWAESELGRGSTFYFTSKFKKYDGNKRVDKSKGRHFLSGKKILIVDDNKTARDIECSIVEKAGMIPICFGSGKDTLNYLKSLLEKEGTDCLEEGSKTLFPPVALIDLSMPEMSGYELSTLIHGLTNQCISMIAISPKPSLGNNNEKGESAFSVFLSKPLRENSLIGSIKKTLGFEDEVQRGETDHMKGEKVCESVKILYVEDNLVNQLLGKKVMERLGHRVHIASDGQEAVNMVKNCSYDIVFMDVHMPKMDGIDATIKIREWERYMRGGGKDHARRIPIVAATADAMKDDSERFMEAGMDGYISKPFRRGDIQRAINGWVHKSGEAEIEEKEKRVLVVEDEEKMRKSIIRVLRRKMPHVKIMTASDGIDAAAKLGSFFPDLILADIMMPHMDGAEFVRYVRNNKRYKNIKVIMMTGLHKEDSRVRAVESAGIEHMIFKPWEDNELVTAIKKSLSNGDHVH